MRLAWIAAIVALLPATVPAQRPPAADLPQQQEHMRQLQFLVGIWEGEGWIEMQPGQRSTFRSWESVESRLGGLVLVIEGRHTDRVQNEERVVHHALAWVSWNEAAGHYDFRTKLADGHGTDASGKLEDGRFVWSPGAPPGMQMRYVIALDDQKRWSEIGEMSHDGKTWRTFFSMTLARKSD